MGAAGFIFAIFHYLHKFSCCFFIGNVVCFSNSIINIIISLFSVILVTALFLFFLFISLPANPFLIPLFPIILFISLSPIFFLFHYSKLLIFHCIIPNHSFSCISFFIIPIYSFIFPNHGYHFLISNHPFSYIFSIHHLNIANLIISIYPFLINILYDLFISRYFIFYDCV